MRMVLIAGEGVLVAVFLLGLSGCGNQSGRLTAATAIA